MFIASNLTPWLLEQLKSVGWFPFMAHVAPVLNRLTPLVVAILMASGVSYTFEPSSGTLTVMHLIPMDIIRGLLLWAVGAVTQHVNYRLFVNRQK